MEHKVRSTLYIWNAMKFDKGDYACIATETFCDPVFSAPAVVEIRCELFTTVYNNDCRHSHSSYIIIIQRVNNADSD